MRIRIKHLMGVIIGAYAVLILLNVIAKGMPLAAKPITLLVVVSGTYVAAARVWRIWPFGRRTFDQCVNARDEAGLGRASKTAGSGRMMLAAQLSVLAMLILVWSGAIGGWLRYEDGISRAVILRALATTSSILVSIGILLVPRIKRTVSYQLFFALALTFFWFFATILLPHVCGLISTDCYGIDRFVYKVPGVSFLPIVALFARRILRPLAGASGE